MIRKNLFKKIYFTLLLLCCASFGFGQYSPDILGPAYQKHTFAMPDDYEGSVISTLIKRTPTHTSDKGILYVHGFNDYFFQDEMATRFDSAGFDFYAVDLRKYGRSLLPNQYPFNVRSLDEYFADIDSAICIMKQEGCKEIILMGHSTGGLISALYAQKNRQNLQINALILNSPFLDMNQSWFKEKILIPIASFLGRWFPNAKLPQGLSPGYAYSLLKEYHGEWYFNTDWKMIQSPALTLGWVRAIHLGHNLVHKGLNIPVPVLVLHSDKSIEGDEWREDFNRGDAVLDVKDIEKYGKTLGDNVSLITIEDGLHDLVLSSLPVRNKTYAEIFAFLKKNRLD